MRAVVVEAGPQRRLAVRDVPDLQAPHAMTVVRVRAISLNRGETHSALDLGADGDRPGWDFAGEVERAPEGGDLSPGDRVAGLMPGGAWAERIMAPGPLLARIPAGVSFEQAAALPVAGLTAKMALEKAGDLKGKRVLVTGATGGVGMLAVQLAARAGAHVTALARTDANNDRLKALGAHVVAVGSAQAAAGGPYDLIAESVGGEQLGEALGWLASRGTCVLFGNSSGDITTFDAGRFRHGPGGGVYGGTSLYGFFLGEELTRALPGPPLEALMDLVAAGQLDPMISVTASWTEVDQVARDLLARRYPGKAVLTID